MAKALKPLQNTGEKTLKDAPLSEAEVMENDIRELAYQVIYYGKNEEDQKRLSGWLGDICEVTDKKYEGISKGEKVTGTPEEIKRVASAIEGINGLADTYGIGKYDEDGMARGIFPKSAETGRTIEVMKSVYEKMGGVYKTQGKNGDYAGYALETSGNSQITKAYKALHEAAAKNGELAPLIGEFKTFQEQAAAGYDESHNGYMKDRQAVRGWQSKLKDLTEALSAKGRMNGKTELYADSTEMFLKTESEMLDSGYVNKDRTDECLKLAQIGLEKLRVVGNCPKKDQEKRIKELEKMESLVKEEYTQIILSDKGGKPQFPEEERKAAGERAMKLEQDINRILEKAGVEPMKNRNYLVLERINAEAVKERGKIMQTAQTEPEAAAEPVAEDVKPAEEQTTEDVKEPETDGGYPVMENPLGVKGMARAFAERLRQVVHDTMTPGEAEFSVENENYLAALEKAIDAVVNVKSGDKRPLAAVNQLQKLSVGEDALLLKDVMDKAQTDDKTAELCANAVRAVMYPLKDEKSGKYLENFYDCYGCGNSKANERQQEYTEAQQDMMIVGRPAEAREIVQCQKDIMTAAKHLNAMEKDMSTQSMENYQNDVEKYSKMADDAEERKNNILETYKPLALGAGLVGISAAYKKHEYNKEWKASVRQMNLQMMTQGTLDAMEQSRQESMENAKALKNQLLR